MRSSIAASTLLLAAVVAASAPAAVAQDSASGTSAALAASAAGANPDALAARAARGAAGAANAALESARKLFAVHRNDEALAAIDAGLKSSPNDARLRFQRGVVLNDSGRSDAAVETFEGLAQDFPELPEPHNNLAVLYAARGDLDRARAALDEAVRALPSYALAHENLGDIHLGWPSAPTSALPGPTAPTTPRAPSSRWPASWSRRCRPPAPVPPPRVFNPNPSPRPHRKPTMFRKLPLIGALVLALSAAPKARAPRRIRRCW